MTEDSPVNSFLEVFKYALKFTDLPLDDNWQGFKTLSHKRLIFSFGLFRGVDVPEGHSRTKLLTSCRSSSFCSGSSRALATHSRIAKVEYFGIRSTTKMGVFRPLRVQGKDHRCRRFSMVGGNTDTGRQAVLQRSARTPF